MTLFQQWVEAEHIRLDILTMIDLCTSVSVDKQLRERFTDVTKASKSLQKQMGWRPVRKKW